MISKSSLERPQGFLLESITEIPLNVNLYLVNSVH